MTATPAPDVTDRSDATDEEFAQRIAGYPADVAHAAMVEQVARAIEGSLESDDPNDWMPRALAAAAIAALPAHPAVEAVKRVEALARERIGGAIGIALIDHRPVSRHICACRWEGDDLRVHLLDVLIDPVAIAALAPQPAEAEGTGR